MDPLKFSPETLRNISNLIYRNETSWDIINRSLSIRNLVAFDPQLVEIEFAHVGGTEFGTGQSAGSPFAIIK